MRIVRIIFLFLFVLAGLYLIACVFIPSGYKVEKSVTIESPVDLVYEQVSTFRQWENWSPLREKDPKLKTLFSSHPGMEGSYWKWKGKKAGEGKMVMTENNPESQILYHIFYKKPYPLECDGYLRMEPRGNQTIVTWGMTGAHPFYLRVANLFMDKVYGSDLAVGLDKLRFLAEKEAMVLKNDYFGYRIKETRFAERRIAYVRKSIPFDEMDDFFSKRYSELYEEAGNCKLKTEGNKLALYYQWDYVNQVANIGAAIPVQGDSTMGSDFGMTLLEDQNALLLDYYGGYKSIGPAYKALDNYIRNKHLQRKDPAIEEYITGPGQERDSSKWHTRVWYLLP